MDYILDAVKFICLQYYKVGDEEDQSLVY